ncbi:MAG TPA: type II toxin-antitoxin system RelE/ParE family toxin [Streptosporangiaceae bacterium]
MTYSTQWSKVAAKHYRALDKPAREQVDDLIAELAENPRPAGIKPVIGMRGVFRARTGDYRVLYTVDDDERELWIEDVRHRSKAYGGH